MKGDTGSTGETGEKGDIGAKGVGISSIESITNGIRFCLTNGVNWDIELTPPTPTYDSIVCFADKPILSYFDGEKATLYAQLMDGQSPASISGVTITFKQGSTTLGTATTDNTGKATLTNGYTSIGVGNVSVTATDGGITSSAYTLEDCTFYDTTSYSTNAQSFNIPLPSNFSLQFDFKTTSRDYSSPYLLVGADNTHKILLGQYARAGGNGLITYNGSTSGTTHNLSTSQLNIDITFLFTYDGNKYSITDGTNSIDVTAISGISLTKLLSNSDGGSGGTIKNIKIKPL